jgi:RNA polymerase sigma-70 factor (ECF subfamily)
MQRELPDHGADPFIVLDKNAMDSRVSAALYALQPEFRMVVILCDIEGFSYEEIAGIMNTSIGTVRSRLHRARKALREALAPHFDAQRRVN